MGSNSWTRLQNEEDLTKAIARSQTIDVAFFKHSTRCGVSSAALKRMEEGEGRLDGLALYYIDVIDSRAVSNAIEQRFGVRHESPQLLLIRAGECTYNSSHYDIEPEKIAVELSN